MSSVTAVPILPVKRGYVLWLWLGILLAVVAGGALAFAAPRPQTGIRLETLRAGKGPHPTNDDIALVNYEGRLSNGTVFDRSQQPTPMPVSAVVPGFSQGLKLMAKGGRYRLTIPPQLGYGPAGAGPIPPNATLVFTVELVDFLPEAQVRAIQQQQMQMMQGMSGPPGGGPAGPGR